MGLYEFVGSSPVGNRDPSGNSILGMFAAAPLLVIFPPAGLAVMAMEAYDTYKGAKDYGVVGAILGEDRGRGLTCHGVGGLVFGDKIASMADKSYEKGTLDWWATGVAYTAGDFLGVIDMADGIEGRDTWTGEKLGGFERFMRVKTGAEKYTAAAASLGLGLGGQTVGSAPRWQVREARATVYRVQGGSGTKTSQARINVDQKGNVSINKPNQDLNVSMKTDAHAKYFQQNRPGSEIVEFKVPKSVADDIRRQAIPQMNYRTNPANRGGTAPKRVDPTKPGESYELPAPWPQKLQDAAIPGSGRVRG